MKITPLIFILTSILKPIRFQYKNHIICYTHHCLFQSRYFDVEKETLTISLTYFPLLGSHNRGSILFVSA